MSNSEQRWYKDKMYMLQEIDALKNQNIKLKARINELEMHPNLDKSIREWKAEGIEEMWDAVGVPSGHCSCNEFVRDYIAKLRGEKDE